ncbi:MAG: proline dehydrogenase family protein [Caldilineales bacterium]|nr:proline dehydrogenase family protein [Caldilineales bacterium]MDW8316740.1 proline dehydrogenase family protein [Anaerolineae bacterium]
MASPLRHVLIALSKNPQMQDLIVSVPVSRRVARRFVAGETLDDAIAAIRAVNGQGMLATLDFLGEHVHSEAEATVNADEYIRALQAIKDANVQSGVSIKLTAMGLAVDDDFCYRNVRRIVAKAAEVGRFVRIDMEDSPVTDRTLAIYRRLRREFSNVGVVVQAYLYRTQEDVRQLMAEGIADLRLCKGAYDEPPAVAFQEKKDVDRNLVELIKLMFQGQADHPGTYPAIASHDHMIINWTKAYAYNRHIPNDCFEFQMLYGVRRELQQALAGQGYRMRVYIPYGTRWYPYFMRRLAERPANLLFFLRALVGE